MKVTILGTCGGIPIPNRVQSGVLVENDSFKMLFDCGSGVPLRLSEAGVAAEEIDLLCLTHGHLDHIQDLPSISKAAWIKTDKAEYDIICPPELVNKVPDWWKSVEEWERVDLDIIPMDDGDIKEINTFVLKAFDTPHRPESQGYKIESEGNSVVYTGDTSANKNIRDVAQGCNLLIHELSLPMKTDLHTSPEELIDLLDGLEIDKLVLTHFYPQILDELEDISKNIENKTGVKTIVGEDLMYFEF